MQNKSSENYFIKKATNTDNKFFFIHGNGFPPKAYSNFLNNIAQQGDTYAICQKPFSKTNINPLSLYGWDIFLNDAKSYVQKYNLNGSIAIGHSMGAILILLLELKNPKMFKKIFLLDPIITSKFRSYLYKVLYNSNLIDFFHPMIKKTKTRRTQFKNFNQIYDIYRKKYIFSKMSDLDLKNYIYSIIENEGENIKIRISREWESAIYRNGSLKDNYIWNNIHNLSTPTIMLSPPIDDFGHFNYGSQLIKKNSSIRYFTVKKSTHLFPMERPQKTAQIIMKNLNLGKID